MRRRFPDGSLLETRILGVILSVERSALADDDDPFTVLVVSGDVPARASVRGRHLAQPHAIPT